MLVALTFSCVNTIHKKCTLITNSHSTFERIVYAGFAYGQICWVTDALAVNIRFLLMRSDVVWRETWVKRPWYYTVTESGPLGGWGEVSCEWVRAEAGNQDEGRCENTKQRQLERRGQSDALRREQSGRLMQSEKKINIPFKIEEAPLSSSQWGRFSTVIILTSPGATSHRQVELLQHCSNQCMRNSVSLLSQLLCKSLNRITATSLPVPGTWSKGRCVRAYRGGG